MRELIIFIVVILCAIFQVLTGIINISSWIGVAFTGWFYSEIRDIYDKSGLEVIPAAWTFHIWIFIYVYQLVWISYGISLLFRRTNDGLGFLHYRPEFMSVWVYALYMLNLVLDVGWLFTFDRGRFAYSSPILAGVSLTVIGCLAISFRGLSRHGVALLRTGHRLEIRLVRGLVQNGLAMYGTWVTVTSVINFGMLAADSSWLTSTDASTLCLGVIGVELAAFVVLDLGLLDKYTRYIVTPYVVTIYALVGIVDGCRAFGGRNLPIAGLLLSFAIFAFVFKGLLVVWRSRTEPEPLLREVRQR